MPRKSLLVRGVIPTATECPFSTVCVAKRDKYCKRDGVEAHRCELAIAYDRMRIPNPNVKNYDYCGSWKKQAEVPSDGV